MEWHDRNLHGCVALVTGASSGIGLATAWELGRLGMKIGLLSRNEEKLLQLQKQMDMAGIDALALQGDISQPDQVNQCLDQLIDRYGKLDILVNNAGILKVEQFERISLDDFDEIFQINVKGTFIVTQTALPYLKKSTEAYVIFIASLGGKRGIKQAAPYTASKNAIKGLAESFYEEVKRAGIRVTVLNPGSTDTSLDKTNAIPRQDDRKSKMMMAEDIAYAVKFLVTSPKRVLIPELDLSAYFINILK